MARKCVSKYKHDFEHFFHEKMGYKILSDPAQYQYVESVLAPTQDVQAVFVDAKAGTGKALRNGSKIQTPYGPVAIETLLPGMEVLGSDGKSHLVKGVFPQGSKEIIKVHFTNGTIVECCEEHLWTYSINGEEEKTTSLSALMEEINLDEIGTITLPALPVVSYPSNDLVVSPELLGRLINNNKLPDYSLVKLTKAILSSIEDEEDKKKALKLIGNTVKTPRIPEEYLVNVVPARLELLRSLVEVTQGSNSYATPHLELAKDIQNLAHSLGLYTKIEDFPVVADNYVLYSLKFPPQLKEVLDEKRIKPLDMIEGLPRPTIKAIERTYEHDYMTCISVNSPDKLFLTEGYIPTHNTTMAMASAYYLLSQGEIDSITYIRNAVSLREQGFIPGTIEDKERAYMQPAEENIKRIGMALGNQDLFLEMLAAEQLVCTSTSFLRGVDYDRNMVLIIDEAQNLDLIELQTVLTRAHDNVKVIVIGSSLQVDNYKIKRYGPERLLPFQLYMKHFQDNPSIPTQTIELSKNYRGRFSNYADEIYKTVQSVDALTVNTKNKTI